MLNPEHEAMMAKMVNQGILILQGDRMDIGLDLIALDLVAGEEARILGAPCLVLYGFKAKGFRHLRSFFPGLINKAKSFDNPKGCPSVSS